MTCDWCGADGRPYEVAPPIKGVEKRTRVKVPKKPAVMASACTACAKRLDAAKDAPRLAKEDLVKRYGPRP